MILNEPTIGCIRDSIPLGFNEQKLPGQNHHTLRTRKLTLLAQHKVMSRYILAIDTMLRQPVDAQRGLYMCYFFITGQFLSICGALLTARLIGLFAFAINNLVFLHKYINLRY